MDVLVSILYGRTIFINLSRLIKRKEMAMFYFYFYFFSIVAQYNAQFKTISTDYFNIYNFYLCEEQFILIFIIFYFFVILKLQQSCNDKPKNY